MIYTLIILISLVSVAVAHLYDLRRQDRRDRAFWINAIQDRHREHDRYLRSSVVRMWKEMDGQLTQYWIKAKLAEKTADRAFNMASSANLATVALAKALQAPRIMTKAQGQRNEIAKKQIDALFSGEDIMDFLKPIASEEELLAIETIQENKRKEMQNGKHKP